MLIIQFFNLNLLQIQWQIANKLMSRSDRSLEILSEVITTSRIIGPEKTKQAIIKARNDLDKILQKKIEELIFRCIRKSFKISQEELMGTRHGVRTDALMVGYVLASKHLDCNLRDIAVIFKKDFSNVSKAITAYNRLQKENKHHESIINKCEKISIIISDFKTKNTWQD